MLIPAQLALLLIPLLPLGAGLLALLIARRRPGLSAGLGIGSLLGSAVLALQLLPGVMQEAVRWSRPWVSWLAPSLPGQPAPPPIELPLALSLGFEQLLFVVTAALLAAGVLIYALRERSDDPQAGRFHANITLFAGSMLLLLCADALLLVYAAWELLGLFSLLLIGHAETPEAWRSARQAFWTTRATDTGLLFALLIAMGRFGLATLTEVDHIDLARLPEAVQLEALAWFGTITVFVLLAVVGKSAQWPLSFWLADAMVAPAPVSALLHAATLVAAGPYLLVRLAPLYANRPELQWLIAVTGGLALVLGGLMALHVRDPKRVLAYSTVSQLGLCIMGCGLLAQHAAFYQLLAHAWCKAALFLAVGALAAWWHARQAHAGSEASPNLAALAGSAARSPVVLATLVLAGLSLGGLPLLGGALGKEAVLAAALEFAGSSDLSTQEIWVARLIAGLLLLSLPLTAAYLTRLIGLLARPQRAGAGSEATAAADTGGWGAGQLVMLLFALLGSLGLSAPAFLWFQRQLEHLGTPVHTSEATSAGVLIALSLALALAGSAWAWFACVAPPGAGQRERQPGAIAAYFASGMQLREFWYAVAAQGGMWFAILAGRTETRLIERLGNGTGQLGRSLAAASNWLDQHLVDGLRWQACELWWRIRRLHSRYLQNGDVQHYMLIVLLSAVVLCLVIIRPLSHIFARVLERM